MLDIPFVKQPDSMSCALASYTMVAKHFFPEATFDDISKVSDWQKGYVIWAYKFWFWIASRGIKITDYDLIDAKAWADEGIEGLRKSVSKKELEYYLAHTKNIESYSEDIKRVLANSNFSYKQEKPTFGQLEKAINEGKVCEVILDSRTLRDREGFSLHRVVVLGIENGQVVFHDPAVGPKTRATVEKFKEAWLTAVSQPELCIYEN